jgi:hypothetical protein
VRLRDRGVGLANKVFEQLLLEQLQRFTTSFTAVSRSTFYDEEARRLIHTGEFGSYREAICRDFLRFVVPGTLEIGQGFLMNADDEVSTQCDIVIYDANSTPLIQSESRQRFFPVETVCAVGEVKSNLSRTELKDALGKLAAIKTMKEKVPDGQVVTVNGYPRPYDPENNYFDQLFTFLICESFSFDAKTINLDDLYEGDLLHRHNLILSLKDGCLCYRAHDINRVWAYPFKFVDGERRELPSCLIMPSEDYPYGHMKALATYMFIGTTNATILTPDFTTYMQKDNNWWFLITKE